VPRSTVVLTLVQAAVFGVAVQWAAPRLTWLALLLGLAALAQLLAGAFSIAGRGVRATRWAGLIGLVATAVVVGLFLQLGLHIENTFAESGQDLGWNLVGEAMLVLPWGAAIPLWQFLSTRPAQVGGSAGGLVGLVLLPATVSAVAWPEPEVRPNIDGVAAAAWLEGHWRGEVTGPPPEGAGPVELYASRIRHGESVETQHVVADDLATALVELEGRLAPDEALLLEHVTSTRAILAPWLAPYPAVLIDPGREHPVTGKPISPRAYWQGDDGLRWRKLTAATWLPLARRLGATHAAKSQAWLARGEVTALDRGWSAGADLTEGAILQAVTAAAQHLLVNMSAQGRFTYVVAGPSGKRKRGYNFPRHAGTTWFLARAAARTGDPALAEGAERALGFLKRSLVEAPGGGSYVLDPGRKDGLAWSGTTGLALLAFAEQGGHDATVDRMARWLASAVDEEGVFRGNYDRASSRWPEQPEITYAQGQGLLALAAAERAGLGDVGSALDRAGAYVDGAYMPRSARHVGTLDDHWMCLAASAVGEVRDTPHGEDVCRAYLHGKSEPFVGGPSEPSAGASAAIAEAEIALAEIERRRGVVAGAHARSITWGRYLLSQQYQASDAPLLGLPQNLIGGFRDRPWKLDVRIDAVQHITSALMGVEQLLANKDLPGAMP